MAKRALLTGVTGQDGAYLSELLIKKGYEVHGIKRRASLFNTDRIDHLYQDPHENNRHFVLHYGDLTDSTNLIRIIQDVQPDEIYNLGAMSHVKKHVFIKLPLQNYMDWCRKCLKAKKRHFILVALTLWQNYMRIG